MTTKVDQKKERFAWIKERASKVRWLAFIIERDGQDTFKVSIGRVMTWIVFGLLCYMWVSGMPVPETMIASFYLLVAYNVTKKLEAPLMQAMSKKIEQGGKDEA